MWKNVGEETARSGDCGRLECDKASKGEHVQGMWDAVARGRKLSPPWGNWMPSAEEMGALP